jgi:hypothetical protein
MNEAFVYRWTNIKTKKWYIGFHLGNLDDNYISSSKYFNKEYERKPNDFVREILAKGTCDEMYRLETKLLNDLDASNNSLSYNEHNNDFTTSFTKMREKIKEMKKHNKWIGKKREKGFIKQKSSDGSFIMGIDNREEKMLEECVAWMKKRDAELMIGKKQRAQKYTIKELSKELIIKLNISISQATLYRLINKNHINNAIIRLRRIEEIKNQNTNSIKNLR